MVMLLRTSDESYRLPHALLCHPLAYRQPSHLVASSIRPLHPSGVWSRELCIMMRCWLASAANSTIIDVILRVRPLTISPLSRVLLTLPLKSRYCRPGNWCRVDESAWSGIAIVSDTSGVIAKLTQVSSIHTAGTVLSCTGCRSLGSHREN